VSGLGAALAEQGQRLIFLNVLLQQIGVPVPAEPTLVVAGSLAAGGRLSVVVIAGAALMATLLADLIWFMVGRRYGKRALRLVFRLSSSPEHRLDQTERLFSRWGPVAFALAKFIPGLPMAGPVLAGGLGTTLRVFLVYDLLAMSLWAGAFTVLGIIFHRDVDRALGALEHLGGWALLVGAALVIAAIARGWYKVRAAGRLSDLPPPPEPLAPGPPSLHFHSRAARPADRPARSGWGTPPAPGRSSDR
jgi:membrane protein DedA with SNARE-associated domain